jgi:hypothetical protein
VVICAAWLISDVRLLPLLLRSSRFPMIQETERSACEAVEVAGPSPANIRASSNARIGREVFVRASGGSASEFLYHPMAFVRSPNKTLEPTTMAVTPRAIALSFSHAPLAGARGAPAMVVAHL